MQTRKQNNWLLIVGVVTLAILPLVFVKGEYGGADGEAQAAIEEIHPGYRPWFQPNLTLPSKEIESLLFVVQGSLGAGVLGYVIGLYKGRSQR
jgi:cobalt/nickel transport protein